MEEDVDLRIFLEGEGGGKVIGMEKENRKMEEVTVGNSSNERTAASQHKSCTNNEKILKDDMVGEIFSAAFTDLTKRLAGLELRNQEVVEGEKITIDGIELMKMGQKDFSSQNKHVITILTKGQFQSMITIWLDQELSEEIIYHMNYDQPVAPEEKMLYIKEYMNIVCGHGLSVINGILGSASRLSIPCMTSQETEFLLQQKPQTNRKTGYIWECNGKTLNLLVDYCSEA